MIPSWMLFEVLSTGFLFVPILLAGLALSGSLEFPSITYVPPTCFRSRTRNFLVGTMVSSGISC